MKRGTSITCSQTHKPHGILLRYLGGSSRSNRGELEKSPTKAEVGRMMQKIRIQKDLCGGLNKYKVLVSASLKAWACLNLLGKWGALRRNWQALIWLLFFIMRKSTLVSLSKGLNSSPHTVLAQQCEMYPQHWSSSTPDNARTARALRRAMGTGTPHKWGAGGHSCSKAGLWCSIHHIHGTSKANPRHVFPLRCSGVLVCEQPSLWEAPTSLSLKCSPCCH